MKVSLIAACIAGAAVVALIVMIYVTQVPTAEYSIFVDPFKDPQDLFTTARVTIQNNGNAPLTNVIIDYDGYTDKIPVLKPGQKLILSPPMGNAFEKVTVTSDEGIHVTMPYRLPTKMPGMMGS